MRNPFVIGIAGGSGAGKSSLAAGIHETWPEKVSVIHLDHYFIDRAQMPVLAGKANWDDPRSVNFPKLIKNLQALIESPMCPDVVIIEGFLVLHDSALRNLLDLKIFLNAPHDIINPRRIHPASEHYRLNVIKPMYEKYVLPSMQHADVVYDVSKESQASLLDSALQLIRSRLA